MKSSSFLSLSSIKEEDKCLIIIISAIAVGREKDNE